MRHLVGDLTGLLDQLSVPRVHVVGHDWGAAIAWVLAAAHPERVASLTCLSVGHPGAFAAAGLAQARRSWYTLLFNVRGVAERWLARGDFRAIRDWAHHPEPDEVVARLSNRDALTASLAVYRANMAPTFRLSRGPRLPPIQAPTMGVWSTGDKFLTEASMTGSARFVAGGWRYERVDGVGHWLPLEAPDEVNRLLLDFIGAADSPAGN
jgi:pimeloyl-ACP methyl ester carboxylesterase